MESLDSPGGEAAPEKQIFYIALIYVGQRHRTNINVGEINFRIAKQQRVIKGAFSCINMTKLQPRPPGITSEVWNRCVTVPQAF